MIEQVLIGLIVALVLSVYFCARHRRQQSIAQDVVASGQLPPPTALSWETNTNSSLSLELPAVSLSEYINIQRIDEKAAWNWDRKNIFSKKNVTWPNWTIPATSDALFASIPQFEAFSHIDHHVLDAIHQSSSAAMQEQLSNFGNLKEFVQQHLLDDNLGDLVRLKGYVGEQFAAEHFMANGHHVEFPDTPNNPGYDLTVDGHPWQVKQGISESLISEHFDKYHNIPVVTGTDLAGHFPDHANVLGIPQLDHANIDHVTESSLHGVADLGHISFHIPYITLALSGIREIVLLGKGMTDIESSFKHVVLDAAGTGGGALVGAKVGSALALPLGPLGVLAGGIVGGIAGAISGRKVANGIKRKAFDNAFASYKEQLLHSTNLCKYEEQKLNTVVQNETSRLEIQFKEKLQSSVNSFTSVVSASRNQLNVKGMEFIKSFVSALQHAITNLEQKQLEIFGNYSENTAQNFLDLLWPTERKVFVDLANCWIKNRIKVIKKAIIHFSRTNSKKIISENQLQNIFKEIHDFLQYHLLLDNKLKEEMDNFISYYDNLLKTIEQKREVVDIEYKKDTIKYKEKLLQTVAEKRNTFANFVTTEHNKIKALLNIVIAEGKKLGIDMQH